MTIRRFGLLMPLVLLWIRFSVAEGSERVSCSHLEPLRVTLSISDEDRREEWEEGVIQAIKNAGIEMSDATQRSRGSTLVVVATTRHGSGSCQGEASVRLESRGRLLDTGRIVPVTVWQHEPFFGFWAGGDSRAACGEAVRRAALEQVGAFVRELEAGSIAICGCP